MDSSFKRGSEWRKWDLHVHTASSYDAGYKGDDANELLVKAWTFHNIEAVAITDHFIIDETRINALRALAPDVTIFPGVELRVDKGAPNLHLILIFPETIKLSTLSDDFKAIMLRKNANASESAETIYWDFKDVVEFSKDHGGLISIHAGKKTSGIDREITNSTPVEMAIKKEYAENVDFFELGNVKDISVYKDIVFQQITPKPLVICSDNHDPRSYTIKEYLWIKANPTFDGLVQATMHPSERVYIGSMPQKLEKASKNKSSYIDSISVVRSTTPKTANEDWFNFNLELNSGLIAIIGNKGSGKSALSDVIGHLCKCRSMEYASFLHETRFRRLPANKAGDYFATIIWADGQTGSLALSDTQYGTTIDDSQYLPQQYLELVCNDLDDIFQKEINSVIYSYIDTSEKLNTMTLNDIITNKSKAYNVKILEIKNKIHICNEEIIELEKKLTEDYSNEIKDNLKKCEDKLLRHDQNKPITVPKPATDVSSDYTQKLESFKKEIENCDARIGESRTKLTAINASIGEFEFLEQKIMVSIRDIDDLNSQLNTVAEKYQFDKNQFKMILTTPLEIITENKKLYTIERDNLRNQLDINNIPEESTEHLEVSLLKQKKVLEEGIALLISEADAVEKNYQKYLADLSDWETVRNNIIGNIHTDNSIKYFKKIINYINNDLNNEYILKQDDLFKLIKELFEQKILISGNLKKLYAPVERELTSVLGDIDEKIEFDVELALNDSNFSESILHHINQTMSGKFYGKQEGSSVMRKLISDTAFNNIDSIIQFIVSVHEDVRNNFSSSFKKIKNRPEYYDYLTCLDYISVKFSLKLGGRTLQELSPGERGTVLLVFYLALSKNEIPLIIDQPEDNLDNQSVFDKLVPCITAAKKKRQVIIVTHNPNIAIACDAEQIVYCSMDKINSRINYHSGAIEDKRIREYVVNVLEGTMPAFNLRKDKYSYPYPQDANKVLGSAASDNLLG